MSGDISIEAEFLGVIKTMQQKYGEVLARHGLRMETPKVSVLRSGHAYTSELRIDITKQETRQLVDCFEFFAFKNGEPALTSEELRIWLIEQIEALAK